MSKFVAAWLALREPVDHRSRNAAVTAAAVAALAATPRPRIVDLAAGTGSNHRFLRPRLVNPGRWLLVDRDPALLARARGADLTHRTADLAAGLEAINFGDADLVTASALLDLVSADWLDAFVDRCAAAGVAVLVALTYDGGVAWSDPDPLDDTVRRLVNEHQRGDKGFGPALGPAAAQRLPALLRRRGYAVTAGASPWVLGAEDAALAAALIGGWVEAAAVLAPDTAGRLQRWGERRKAAVAGGQTTLTVGHADVFAVPR